MRDLVWRTARGELLPVSQMETSHIANCIAKIERSGGRWRGLFLERLRLELEIRSMGLTSRRTG
jgi:hypothetical protein